jgi:uncharacterized protein
MPSANAASPGSLGPDLAAVVAAFGHALHAAGVPVTPERSARFGLAIALAEPRDVRSLYWLGRVTLITGQEQIETYDAVFNRIFRGVIDLAEAGVREQAAVPSAPQSAASSGQGEVEGSASSHPRSTSATPEGLAGDDPDEQEASMLAAMSVEERIGEKEFAACTPDELRMLAQLIEALPVIPPMRRGRRSRMDRAGDRLDLRRTLRRSHRTAGDPVHLMRRERIERPRRIVLIADISGSMEPYARVYLHLMRGAVRALSAEAFVFATRLTRISRMLADSHPDVAYAKAAAAAPDWSGGTRIGRALKTFLDLHGRRGMARGSVVVIVSDGWEVEDPAIVGTAMAQLHRLAHHVIWVNPRKAAHDYEPLVGGMAAALPYVDTFVSGHSFRALQDVMDAIRRASDRSLSFTPMRKAS